MRTLARIGTSMATRPFQDAEALVGSMANPDSGIRFVLGITKRAGKRVSEVQSAIFDKLKWTAATAQVWLRDHGFTTPKVDEGATFWRFRQQDPKHYKEFRTVVPGTRQNPGGINSPGKREFRLKFGDRPYDLVPEKMERYHVVDGRGFIIGKYDNGYIADSHAKDSSEDAPEETFQVIDTRDGSVYSTVRSGEDVVENPAYFTTFKTRKEAEAAWADSMPGRNDRVRYVRVHGGWRMLPAGPLGGRGHYGTTVDDMERGDTGFVDENPHDATYQVRFIRPDQAGELLDLFHLARTALAGGDASNYNRMLWASKEFSKAHPEVSSTAAYKDLDGLRSNWFGARNPATYNQITAMDEQGAADGDSYTGKYPASSTYMDKAFRAALSLMRHRLVDGRGVIGPKDRASYRNVYFRAFRQGDYRSHKGMMAASSLRTPGAGASSNPTPGEAISAYDEHLATTLDPAFQEATPDEQAAAMTVQDAVENPRPIVVGDKVKYTTKFLRSIGAYTGPMGHGRGIVTGVRPMGGPGSSMLATIDWRDGGELPGQVNTYNLIQAGVPNPDVYGEDGAPPDSASIQVITRDGHYTGFGDYTPEHVRESQAWAKKLYQANGEPVQWRVYSYFPGGEVMQEKHYGRPGYENPPRRFPMPPDDSPASIRKVMHIVHTTTSLRTLHDAWAWAGQWNVGGDVWLPGQREGQLGVIGMIHAKLAKHGKSFDDLMSFEKREANPAYGAVTDPEIQAEIDSHPGTWFTNLAYPHHTRHTGGFDEIYAAALEAAVSSNRPVYVGSYLTGHEPPRSSGYALAVWPDGRITWASQVPLNKSNPVPGRDDAIRGILRLKQDFLIMLASDMGGFPESFHITDHPGAPTLAGLREYIYPDWEHAIDAKIRELAASHSPHVGVPDFKALAARSENPDDFRRSRMPEGSLGERALTGLDEVEAAGEMAGRNWRGPVTAAKLKTRAMAHITHLRGYQKSMRGMYQIAFERGFEKTYKGGSKNPSSYDSQHPDLGQAAFDAGKDFRLSGAYYETGVANARVAKYGFNKWYDSQVDPNLRLVVGPAERHNRVRMKTLLKNWMEGWAAGKRVEKKQANPESPAAALYQSFHGRPSAETLEIITERNEHEWLTGLGTLVELKVATVTQLDATISFARDKKAPELCSSEDGRQLYIEGGDQALDLKALKMAGDKWEKDSMVIGVLYELTYQTGKSFHKFKLTDYFHKLGEETGVQPTLLYDPNNRLLSISGGQYQVKPEGIVN